MRVVKNDEGYYELKLKRNGEWETVFRGTQEECFEGIQNVKLD
ncbi:MAG: hypothetical protein RR795_10655 [Cetobacterium sp.]